MFKSFFLHHTRGTGKMAGRSARGYTVFVSPNQEDTSNRTCKVQLTYCSPKDQFNKRIGRDMAQAAEVNIINKRELPEFMAIVDEKMYNKKGEITAQDVKYYSKQWFYTLKYVI